MNPPSPSRRSMLPHGRTTRKRYGTRAERAETRKNSTLAREVELALPSLSGTRRPAAHRGAICRSFGGALQRRGIRRDPRTQQARRRPQLPRAYFVHHPRDDAEGLGKKTRVLDDRKTGPKEVTKLRELAADIINEHLAAAHSDIRVDHRSFKDRGIDREPTTHLGPAAAEMERRGEQTERGDMNRQAAEVNREAEQKETLLAERDALDKAIEAERERISSPPADPEDALERMRDAAEPFREAIARDGSVPNIENDGLKWWQRLGMQLAEKARKFAIALAEKARYFWRSREDERQPGTERDHDDRGIDL